ncbi:MAG: bifunctional riboflavin kinase/FAD synthetase, partial [Alphaproteobacteria bacterium]|nr:bifunctional riboflavin kinase/FAD synthetase [Alphaproteobacteria bacterium]
RLRAEMRFDGLDALKTQMKQDCLDARAVLKSSVEQKISNAIGDK